MTKREEIQVLRNAIEALGTNSYCGPWLASVLAEVESTIRSDYFPTVTLLRSGKECADIIAAASENAAGIVEVAKADAAKVMDRAEALRELAAKAAAINPGKFPEGAGEITALPTEATIEAAKTECRRVAMVLHNEARAVLQNVFLCPADVVEAHDHLCEARRAIEKALKPQTTTL